MNVICSFGKKKYCTYNIYIKLIKYMNKIILLKLTDFFYYSNKFELIFFLLKKK
jgi:hypothetical protein